MNKFIRFLNENSSTLLSFTAGAGVILTAISASKASIEAKEKLEVENPQTKLDKIKTVAPCYIKTAVIAGVTLASIFGSRYLDQKKRLALVAALSAVSKDAEDFKNKATELLGEEKVEEIKKEVAKDKVEETKNKIQRKNVELPGDKFYIYEPYSDQKILVSRERLAFAMLCANEKLVKNFEVSLNEVIKWLGGKPKSKVELYGWNMENESQDYTWGYTGGAWIGLSCYIGEVDGEELLILGYDCEPEEQVPEAMYGYEPPNTK